MTYKLSFKLYATLVRTLANDLHYRSGLSWSEAMKKAHATIKANPDAFIIRYHHKGEGRVVTRVIVKQWTRFAAPKGGASKPTLFVHADLYYVALEKYPVRSARKDSIKSIELRRAA